MTEEELPRYGIQWNGPQHPLATPMEDGYWTPWHLAAARLATVQAELAISKEQAEYWHAECQQAYHWRDVNAASLEACEKREAAIQAERDAAIAHGVGAMTDEELKSAKEYAQIIASTEGGPPGIMAISRLLLAVASRLTEVEAERDQLSMELVEALNDTTRLLDQERRRWYAALACLGDLEGLAPEVVGDLAKKALG